MPAVRRNGALVGLGVAQRGAALTGPDERPVVVVDIARFVELPRSHRALMAEAAVRAGEEEAERRGARLFLLTWEGRIASSTPEQRERWRINRARSRAHAKESQHDAE